MVCEHTIAGQWHHPMLAAQLGHRHPAFRCRSIAMICATVYLLGFIRNLLGHRDEKILLVQPLAFGGQWPIQLDRRRSPARPAATCGNRHPDCTAAATTLRCALTGWAGPSAGRLKGSPRSGVSVGTCRGCAHSLIHRTLRQGQARACRYAPAPDLERTGPRYARR